jgi:hypothetical protein
VLIVLMVLMVLMVMVRDPEMPKSI